MWRMTLEFVVLLALLSGIVLIWREGSIGWVEIARQIPLVESFVPKPCSEPMPYSIGNFDTRFGISEGDFRQAISEAESVWNKESGRILFTYDPSAQFTINLIYDERQQETERLKKLAESLSEVKESQSVLDQKQKSLSARYTITKREYEKLLAQFQRDQKEYNDAVAYWNDYGGAPEDEYKQLLKDKVSLKKAYTRLEKKRGELNDLARSLNTTNRVETKMIEGYNAEVEEYKTTYGEPEEFQEGLYTGKAIDIYQFEDRAQLVLVLAHELGHALGMDHVSNPSSLMYHFMAEQPGTLTLSNEDVAALKTACALP